MAMSIRRRRGGRGEHGRRWDGVLCDRENARARISRTGQGSPCEQGKRKFAFEIRVQIDMKARITMSPTICVSLSAVSPRGEAEAEDEMESGWRIEVCGFDGGESENRTGQGRAGIDEEMKR
jgi:hypothetical protein